MISTYELACLDNVNGNIQDSLNLKPPKHDPQFSGIVKLGPHFRAWETVEPYLTRGFITNRDAIYFDINTTSDGNIQNQTIAAFVDCGRTVFPNKLESWKILEVRGRLNMI